MSSRIVFIQGKKTVLRPLLESDVPMLMRWINDPDVRHYLLGYWPMLEQNEKDWIKSAATDRSNMALVMEDLEGKAFGTMGLHRIDMKNRHATTGALIGEKEYWGKGYGTDAKLHLLQYAFDELNLHRVGSIVHAFNERSIRYSQRCGYRVEARMKDMIYRNGRYWDDIHLVVFREDWEKVWDVYQRTGEVR